MSQPTTQPTIEPAIEQPADRPAGLPTPPVAKRVPTEFELVVHDPRVE